jgi:hypothetical protein
MEMIKICENKGRYCLQKGFEAQVGNKTYTFCCEAGFEQSIEDFTKYIGDQYNCHICNDKGIIKYKGIVRVCPAGCTVIN